MSTRVPLDRDALRAWMVGAHLHPNANWYVPVYDARRRGLFYLTTRHLLSVDEPNLPISDELARVLDRWERRDGSLKAIRQMPDEDRVKLVLDFIVSCAGEQRDRLLERFAERPWIVFGWRPGALESFVDEGELAERWRAHLERACDARVSLEISMHRLDARTVYAIAF